jgi:uncharacterized membrane-anchored protein
MSSMNPKQTTESGTSPIKVIVLINFGLMILLVGPGSSHRLDLALRRAGVANLITIFLQTWVVGSTILMTLWFVWRLVSKAKGVEDKQRRPATSDWILLLAWWAVLVLLCLYAFMMGMGG